MPRVKFRVASRARRKKILSATRGYFGKKANCITIAKDAFWRSGQYAFRDRRAKKREFRALWIMRINAAARINGLSYSDLISGLKAKNVELNRCPLGVNALYSGPRYAKKLDLNGVFKGPARLAGSRATPWRA